MLHLQEEIRGSKRVLANDNKGDMYYRASRVIQSAIYLFKNYTSYVIHELELVSRKGILSNFPASQRDQCKTSYLVSMYDDFFVYLEWG